MAVNFKAYAKACAILARIKLKYGTNTSIDILDKLLHEKNFTIVYMPFDSKISGFSSKHGDHYIIILNSNDNHNRQNFTCAHELFHLFYEYDEHDNFIKSAKSEKIADLFASYFLVPEEAFYIFLKDNGLINKRKILISDIVKIENYFKVSRYAILIRLKDEGLIDQDQFETFNKNVISTVRSFGGDVSKYVNGDSIKKTYGEYEKLANSLFDKGKITNGKFEEYLIDAFRADLVYGNVEDDNGNKSKR